MSKEARLIAAVVAAVVVIVGGLVLFSGDDDPQVNASDTPAETSDTAEDGASSTSSAADTTTSAPLGGTSTTTSPSQSTETTAAAVGSGGDGDTTGGALNGTAGGDSGNASGATGGSALGQPSVSDLAPWQTDLDPGEVRNRFDVAEASNDRCVRLIALTSLPNLNDLPAQSQAELSEYFTRWQRLADITQPQTNGLAAARLIEARNALKSIENTVNRNGGTFNEAAVDEVLGGTSEDLEKLLGFFTTVADVCPGPDA